MLHQVKERVAVLFLIMMHVSSPVLPRVQHIASTCFPSGGRGMHQKTGLRHLKLPLGQSALLKDHHINLQGSLLIAVYYEILLVFRKRACKDMATVTACT
jgi:hypothetical protein